MIPRFVKRGVQIELPFVALDLEPREDPWSFNGCGKAY